MRVFEDMVILRPREDLEQKWNSASIITPDTALIGVSHMTGERHDRACIGEVVEVGPGNADCPDMSSVKKGDIVVLPLFSCSKVVALKEEICLLVKSRALAAVVTDLGDPRESLRAINDYVLTRQDREAFELWMHGGLLLPEDFLSDGLPVDGGTDGIVRVCLERCMSTGGGCYTKKALWKPRQRKGELLCLNPLASCRFRRFGQFFRLTPAEDCQFALEE
jgi:co-chaperonin GroES (HSP10)